MADCCKVTDCYETAHYYKWLRFELFSRHYGIERK
jgi:hypothetical protein